MWKYSPFQLLLFLPIGYGKSQAVRESRKQMGKGFNSCKPQRQGQLPIVEVHMKVQGAQVWWRGNRQTHFSCGSLFCVFHSFPRVSQHFPINFSRFFRCPWLSSVLSHTSQIFTVTVLFLSIMLLPTFIKLKYFWLMLSTLPA